MTERGLYRCALGCALVALALAFAAFLMSGCLLPRHRGGCPAQAQSPAPGGSGDPSCHRR